MKQCNGNIKRLCPFGALFLLGIGILTLCFFAQKNAEQCCTD
ncbi:MAG: hypothetical protein R3Y63_07445 [Eubacteriales bacterium]